MILQVRDPAQLSAALLKCTPSETAVPYAAFKNAGFEVHFATENGKTPECDKRMLEGITQMLLV